MAKLTQLLVAVIAIALLSCLVRYSAEANENFWWDIQVCEEAAGYWQGPIPDAEYRCIKKDALYNWSHCYIEFSKNRTWFVGDLLDRHYSDRYHEFETVKTYFAITQNKNSLQNWYRHVLVRDAVKACRK